MDKLALCRDLFEFSEKWELVENINEDQNPDSPIIGKIRGPFFVVEGSTINKRFYSRKLWENTIKNTESMMAEGAMVGTVGHDLALDDKAFREGNISHKITKLYINEDNNQGYGECDIIKTPAGRNLKIYVESGIKLAVSSRAMSKYSGTKGKDKIVDENNYVLEGFDFVRNPGVEFAYPKLVNEDISQSIEEKPMTENVNEQIIRDKLELESRLTESLTTNSNLKDEIAILNDRNKTMINTIEQLTNENKNLNARVHSLSDNLALSNESINEYKNLGTPEEINECLDKANNVFKKLLEFNKDYGTLEDAKTVIDISEKYSELANISEIEECIKLLGKYSKFGSPDNVARKLRVYEDLGRPDEIAKILDFAEGIQNGALEFNATKMSEEFGVDKDTVVNLVDKLGIKESRKILESVKSSKVDTRYVKTNENVTVSSTKNNNTGTTSIVNKSRLQRVMESTTL
jgi:hypothetical protein